MYLSTSTSTEDFPEMYSSTFQVLYKLYLSTDVLKYKVLLPGSASKVNIEKVMKLINSKNQGNCQPFVTPKGRFFGISDKGGEIFFFSILANKAMHCVPR